MNAPTPGERPLAGLVVAVTRSPDRAGGMVRQLEDLGARVFLAPAIAVLPPEDLEPLRRGAQRLEGFDWVVFSSAEAVRAFAPLALLDGAGAWPPRVRVAAVGPATKAALEAAGIPVSLMPAEHTGAALVPAMRDRVKGARVLFPASAIAGPDIPEGLRALGASVEQVTAYRTVAASGKGGAGGEGGSAAAPAAILEADWVLFCSPSSVEATVVALGAWSSPRPAVASIGPSTSAACRRAGLAVALESPEHTAEGLVRALGARSPS